MVFIECGLIFVVMVDGLEFGLYSIIIVISGFNVILLDL